MAKSPSASTDPDRVEEVFTDLHGTPDPDKGGADTDIDTLDNALIEQPANNKTLDEELEVVDDEPVEEAPAEPEAPAAEPTPEPPPAKAAEPEEVEYDPKDAYLLASKGQNLSLRKSHATAAETAAKATLERAKNAYLAAKESGDSKGEVAAWEEFADAKVSLARVTDELQNLAGEENALRSEFNALAAKAPKDAQGNPIWDKKVVKRAAAPAPSGQPSKLVPQFLKSNPWFNDPKSAAKATVLRGLDQELASEGKIDKDTPAYWAELGRRFNRVYPGVYKGLDGKPIATGERRRGAGAGDGSAVPSAAGGGSGTAPRTPNDPKSIRLTNDDIVQMGKFGMEDTPANRRAWLTEKRAMAQGAH